MIWYESASTTIIFPWILNARINSTLSLRNRKKKNRNPSYFESRKCQESRTLLEKIRRVSPAKQNKGLRVLSFVDQATPRFELGKKDLQSPALPLGHAAKTIQNRWKNSPFACFVWGGYSMSFLFFVYVHIKSRFS